MNSDLLYDEFGNYVGPELAFDDSDGEDSDSDGREAAKAQDDFEQDDEYMAEDGNEDDQVKLIYFSTLAYHFLATLLIPRPSIEI